MNSNCLQGFKCPDCGSEGPFRIEISAMAIVHDDGVDEVEGVEWEDTSTCWCLNCMSAGDVKKFRTDEEDDTHCRECGEPCDNGEGWDGLCGNCADKLEELED